MQQSLRPEGSATVLLAIELQFELAHQMFRLEPKIGVDPQKVRHSDTKITKGNPNQKRNRQTHQCRLGHRTAQIGQFHGDVGSVGSRSVELQAVDRGQRWRDESAFQLQEIEHQKRGGGCVQEDQGNEGFAAEQEQRQDKGDEIHLRANQIF